MKQSEVFLEAAKRIFYKQNRYACDAILEIESDFENIQNCLFDFKYFFEEQADYYIFWWEDTTPENQLARQIALLLMHEICKDEEKTCGIKDR